MNSIVQHSVYEKYGSGIERIINHFKAAEKLAGIGKSSKILTKLKAMKDSFIVKQYICPRRCFYPSLNLLPNLNRENIASRILFMPLYLGLEKETLNKICQLINEK